MGSIKIPTSIFFGHIGWEMGSRGGGEANLPFLFRFLLAYYFRETEVCAFISILKACLSFIAASGVVFQSFLIVSTLPLKKRSPPLIGKLA